MVKKEIICVGLGLFGLSNMKSDPESRSKKRSVIDNKKRSHERILEVSILNGNWDQSIAHAISENSNKTDWVGIYGLNETPGKDSAYRFGYINENGIAVLNKGTDKLPKGEKLIPGKYIAYLFADDSYQILDSKIIFI